MWNVESARRRDSQPDGDESHDEAQNDVERRAHDVSLLDEFERLKLESGESGVGSDEADRDEQSPIGMNRDPLADQCHKKADDKRAGDIDDESSQRELRRQAGADQIAEPVSRDRADRAA